MSDIQNIIIQAISAHLVVNLNYKGSWRTVEPHLLGVNKKGNICLSAFQLSGGSGSSWRAFLVASIEQAVLSEVHFELRYGYNPNDNTMDTIIIAA